MANEEEKSLTIDDTPVNRYKEFVKYAITHFNVTLSTELSWAKSKDNVKFNKYELYLTNTIDATISVTMGMYYFGKAAGAMAAGATAAPLLVGLGKCTNLILKDFFEDRLKVA